MNDVFTNATNVNILSDTINGSDVNYNRVKGYKNEFEYKSTIYNRIDDTTRINKDKDVADLDDKFINIYRYKFTQEFMDILHNFSKIHQYDDRHVFKESWTNWIAEYEEQIKLEVERLSYNGYEGDILDKMFKSARYYFRKKSTIKSDAKERREYISLQKEILILMDTHIKENELKPADGFIDFCNKNVEGLKLEIAYLIKNNINDYKIIQDKLKKTYKNRYFLLNK